MLYLIFLFDILKEYPTYNSSGVYLINNSGLDVKFDNCCNSSGVYVNSSGICVNSSGVKVDDSYYKNIYTIQNSQGVVINSSGIFINKKYQSWNWDWT